MKFTEDEISVLREKNKDLNDKEFSAFLSACNRYELNPLANQIYVQIKSKNEPAKRAVSYVAQIDGYRLIADRTGNYAGNDDPRFDNEELPKIATVTVYKIVAGVRCPFQASARWAQYLPQWENQQFMWKRMPHLMLGKCAEALALRKAFPAELSGLYTAEEMEQAKDHDEPNGRESVTKTRTPEEAHAEMPGKAAPKPDITKAPGYATSPLMTPAPKTRGKAKALADRSQERIDAIAATVTDEAQGTWGGDEPPDDPKNAMNPMLAHRGRLMLADNMNAFGASFAAALATIKEPADDECLRRYAVEWLREKLTKVLKPTRHDQFEQLRTWFAANLPNQTMCEWAMKFLNDTEAKVEAAAKHTAAA